MACCRLVHHKEAALEGAQHLADPLLHPQAATLARVYQHHCTSNPRCQAAHLWCLASDCLAPVLLQASVRRVQVLQKAQLPSQAGLTCPPKLVSRA